MSRNDTIRFAAQVGTSRLDMPAIKRRAAGRWPEILSAVAGIPREFLHFDSQEGPCPKCGGITRYRGIDEAAGALYCSHCFNDHNGDGLAAIQWFRGCDFLTAARKVAEFLGIDHGNGNGRADYVANGKSKNAANLAASIEGLHPIDDGDTAALLEMYSKAKPPITAEGARRCRGTLAIWRGFRCIRLDARVPIDAPVTTAIVLCRVEGEPFPATGKLGQRKTHTLAGSVDSWLSSGTAAEIEQAHTILDVEGVTDLLAVASVGLPAGWIAVTNVAGAKARGKLPRPWAKGKRVIVAGDTDMPGMEGQRRSAAAYHRAAAAEVLLGQLPYPARPDRGKDLRDFFNDGYAIEDLRTEEVSAEEAAKWQATTKQSAIRHERSTEQVPGLIYPEGRTEVANAKRLAQKHGDKIRWCEPWGRFLVWDGQRWAVDHERQADAIAKDVYQALWHEVADAVKSGTGDEIREMSRFARQTGTARGIDALLKLVRSEPGIPIAPGELDRDNWLFNVANGTLDLRTGELLPHRREDKLTKLCPVEFDSSAECPIWLRVLHDITAGDEALAAYLRKAAGCSLSGDVSEHVLFFLYGTGANGKSTFLNTIQEMMGPDYSMKAPPDLLMVKSDAHPTERADLAGKRFVACNEAAEGRRLAEALVKEMTGGDKVRARRMREDFWEFNPTHKIWLAANHKPNIRGTDEGIWRRMKLIPFTVSIAPDRQDKGLAAKLAQELPGILRWAVQGCLEWRTEGLAEPQAVLDATGRYRREQDELARFLHECCVFGPDARARAGDLLAAFHNWAGDRRMSQRRLGEALTERGYEDRKIGGYVWRFGIGLRKDDVAEQDSGDLHDLSTS